jgi:hypothetical protein
VWENERERENVFVNVSTKEIDVERVKEKMCEWVSVNTSERERERTCVCACVCVCVCVCVYVCKSEGEMIWKSLSSVFVLMSRAAAWRYLRSKETSSKRPKNVAGLKKQSSTSESQKTWQVNKIILKKSLKEQSLKSH